MYYWLSLKKEAKRDIKREGACDSTLMNVVKCGLKAYVVDTLSLLSSVEFLYAHATVHVV